MTVKILSFSLQSINIKKSPASEKIDWQHNNNGTWAQTLHREADGVQGGGEILQFWRLHAFWLSVKFFGTLVDKYLPWKAFSLILEWHKKFLFSFLNMFNDMF